MHNKLIVEQVPVMEPGASLPFSKQPAPGHHPEPRRIYSTNSRSFFKGLVFNIILPSTSRRPK